MTIEMERETAEELIHYKLRDIRSMIQDILNRWNENGIEQFLEHARDGTHPDAENDAIDLRQLIIEEEKLVNLLGAL